VWGVCDTNSCAQQPVLAVHSSTCNVQLSLCSMQALKAILQWMRWFTEWLSGVW